MIPGRLLQSYLGDRLGMMSNWYVRFAIIFRHFPQ